jgi:hypothetical protein
MKSKAEVIRETLAALRVLDIGGLGYGGENAYERELKEAWAQTKLRTTVDRSEHADLRINLNDLPLPPLDKDRWDITTAFDVLEHLDHPVEILRWIPTSKALISVPNALSALVRRMEATGYEHLYSFTSYTAGVLLERGGWKVERWDYTFGKWSLRAQAINCVGSLWPSRVATGLMFHCSRKRP